MAALLLEIHPCRVPSALAVLCTSFIEPGWAVPGAGMPGACPPPCFFFGGEVASERLCCTASLRVSKNEYRAVKGRRGAGVGSSSGFKMP